MFRLVGPEHFRIGRFECKLNIEPDGTFGLLYSLFVNDMPVEEFLAANKKKWITWTVEFSNGNQHHILFGRIKIFCLILQIIELILFLQKETPWTCG